MAAFGIVFLAEAVYKATAAVVPSAERWGLVDSSLCWAMEYASYWLYGPSFR